jgi:hypothetical protein
VLRIRHQQSLVTTTKSFNVEAHGVLSCSNGCIKKVGLTNVWLSIRNQSWAVSTKTNQIFYAFLISPVPGTGFEPSATGITKCVFCHWATGSKPQIKREWSNKYKNGFVTDQQPFKTIYRYLFYKQLFHTKVLCAPFMCLQFGFVIFWWKDFGAKAAHKMLVKLTPGRFIDTYLLTLLKRIVFNQTVIHMDGYFMSNQIDFWFNYQWPVL